MDKIFKQHTLQEGICECKEEGSQDDEDEDDEEEAEGEGVGEGDEGVG